MSETDLTELLAEANQRLRSGDTAGSVSLLERAAAHSPGDPRVLLLLGLARERAGELAEAEACLRRILETPALPGRERAELTVHLARVLRRRGRHDDAVAALQAVLSLQPDSARLLRNLGDALHGAGRAQAALDCYESAQAREPGDWLTLNNMALALLALERPAAAEQKLRQAIRLNPPGALCLNNLGEALMRQSCAGEAAACFERALAQETANPVAVAGRARALSAQGDFTAGGELAAGLPRGFPFPGVEESFLDYQLQRFAACDWADHAGTLERIRSLTQQHLDAQRCPPLKPLAALECFPEDTAFCQAVAAAWSARVRERVGLASTPAAPGNARIRVAYVSPDFRVHPVAFLIRDLFRHHDRKRFEIIACSLAPTDGSELADTLRETADEFVDLSEMADTEATARLRAMEPDLAVDLAGYTAAARPAVLAARPAPVQDSYVGYFGSLQADWIDYIVGSETLLSAARAQDYTEAILRLEPTPFVIDGFGSPQVPNRSDAGLPSKGTVLGCFHRSRKLTPEIFDAWMEILKRAPTALLWLRADTEQQQHNLTDQARESGTAEQVVFAPRVPFHEHVARQALADIALDVPGFGGFNTNAIALWCGVPLLTLPGKSYASCVGAAALEACAMPDMVVHDLDQYVQRAVALCENKDALAELRLRTADARHSPLFAGAAATRRLERAWSYVVERSRRGEPPVPKSFSG